MKSDTLRLIVVALVPVNMAANAGLVVDRGLPTGNWNDAAGALRSNISIAYAGTFLFSTDDFTLPAPPNPGLQGWTITSIRTWVVGEGTTPLGTTYPGGVTLYLGPNTAGAALAAAASSTFFGNVANNPDVTVTPVTYGDGSGYQGSLGGYHQIYQIDFNNLGITYGVGEAPSVRFGVYMTDGIDTAYNHASNAANSVSPQQGSDGKYNVYDIATLLPDIGPPSGEGVDTISEGVWGKTADLNVQVFAIIPEPETTTYVGWGVLALLLGRMMSLRRCGGSRT